MQLSDAHALDRVVMFSGPPCDDFRTALDSLVMCIEAQVPRLGLEIRISGCQPRYLSLGT